MDKHIHPEVNEIEHICATSPHTKHTHDICEKIKQDERTKKKEIEKAHHKKERKLDDALDDTFPASDPTTKY